MSGAVNTIPMTGGGYNCNTCGLFVSWGSYHICYGASAQWVTPLARYYTCQECRITATSDFSYLNDKPICRVCLDRILKGQPALEAK